MANVILTDNPALCACGCGKPTAIPRWTDNSKGWIGGVPLRYVRGHNNFRHGAARQGRSLEYQTWLSMRQRCLNPKAASFTNYGGRGIAVCSRWDSFENFLADMGFRPSPAHTIERVDNNAGYRPDNCKWATAPEQGRNKRSVKLNPEAVKVIRFMLQRGVLRSFLARLHGVSRETIRDTALGKRWEDL